ncbi:MAG: geranylgeranyl reductase family protein [Candidatus Hodarchaeota archaeon]
MSFDADVVVIGAGPAGLSAAKALSDSSLDFLVLCREKNPCEMKPCGGFIPARAIDEFDLGQMSGAYPIRSVRMKFPNTDVKAVHFEKDMGINISRGDLARAQLKQIGLKLDSIRTGTEVNKIKITQEVAELEVTIEGRRHSLSCQSVIDCSGVNPVSLRSKGLRERIPNTQMGYAVQYQMTVQPENRSFLESNDFFYGSDFSPRGYAWVFPRESEVAVGTGGIVERVRNSAKRVQEYLDNLIQNIEPARTALKNSEIIRKEAALMPLAGIVKPSFSDRILLAGDAAGHCSPITGEGIHYAMQAGRSAAETLTDAIEKGDLSRKFLSRYEKRWIGIMGSDLKWGFWLQKRFLESGSRSIGSKFLNSEKSARIIAEMLLGGRSVRSAILKAAPGYIRSKIS